MESLRDKVEGLKDSLAKSQAEKDIIKEKDAKLQQQLKEVRSTRQPAQIIFMDLNGLKKVNDQLGHESGDAMLVRFSEALRKCFRDGDIVGRLGGDEFCIFAKIDANECRMLLQRLQQALDVNDDKTASPGLSASIGIVDVQANPTASLETLISMSDAAMYVEKQRTKAAAGNT